MKLAVVLFKTVAAHGATVNHRALSAKVPNVLKVPGPLVSADGKNPEGIKLRDPGAYATCAPPCVAYTTGPTKHVTFPTQVVTWDSGAILIER